MKHYTPLLLLLSLVVAESCDPADNRLTVLNKSNIPLYVVLYVPTDSSCLAISSGIYPDSIGKVMVLNSIDPYFVACDSARNRCTRIYYFNKYFTLRNSSDIFENMDNLYHVDTISSEEAKFFNYNFIVH
jgi:hypothetical protein